MSECSGGRRWILYIVRMGVCVFERHWQVCTDKYCIWLLTVVCWVFPLRLSFLLSISLNHPITGKFPPTVFIPEPRICSVKPCALRSSCSMWCRHRWRPTTSSCPMLKGTPHTPRAVSAPTPSAAALCQASTTRHSGCPGTVPKRTHTPIRTLMCSQSRLTVTPLCFTPRFLRPSPRRVTPTHRRRGWTPRQQEAIRKKSGGGSAFS